MRKIWLLGLTLVTLAIVLWFNVRSLPRLIPTVAAPPPKPILYEQRNLPESIAHILLIPANSRFLVTPALSEKVGTVEEFAQKYGAIAIFNAGFFDPANQKSTSYVIIQGKLVADPKQNDRLVNNPNLKPYLGQIFNRTEFRRYLCGQTIKYDIALHNQSAPTGCQLVDAIGAGPRLLPKLTLVQEAFVDNANKRDALGSNQPNARTAVGITHDGSIVLVMVAQKPSARTNSGISLPALADFMKTLGIQKAMNLDGGSSSSVYYKGKTFYGKIDLEGNSIKRPVKSVLLVQEN
ncbi:phosphodiester glycosidase family protein [Desmonostoc muscorum LEGE 12446]|uniref:Phosphodiester glycosidase family protein n=1 Tax=Desmonostoc muscorum LEGE 12446 TaxID=1828758 RepID=A0A8J7D8H9_DESMC|nr:phosphodiester glycosidase family protein [Desmonostoc muscorum]MCF2146586.1 phosphodiester glycosidase family protein [Desmonostoc muscorum LEGE 12446]